MAANSSDITVYHAVPTRSCRIIFLLEELGLPYKLVTKEFLPFGLRDDKEYMENVNPKGALPGFKDGDVTLIESLAMILYLEERYDPDHKLSPPPSDKAGRAAFLNWLTFAEATYASSIVYPVMHEFVLPEENRNPKAAASFRSATEENLHILNKAMEGKPKGIVNNQFSAADIALYQATYLAAEFLKLVSKDTYPHVAAWYAEIAKRPAAAKAYAA